VFDECVGAIRGNFFVVVAAEKRTSVNRVEFIEDIVDPDELIGGVLVDSSNDVQPGCESKSNPMLNRNKVRAYQ